MSNERSGVGRRRVLRSLAGVGVLGASAGAVGAEPRRRTAPAGRERDRSIAESLPPPETEWARTYGGSYVDTGVSLIESSDGGYLMAGVTQPSASERVDGWLVKVDDRGTEQWQRSYGGTGTDFPFSVVETSDGGYLLAGQTGATGSREASGWALKVDDRGNEQWQRSYGGTAEDSFISVTEASEGGYLLAGRSGSAGSGGLDAWLVRVDDQGRTQWEQTYGGSGDDSATSVLATGDGDYLFGGWTTASGGGDAWLVRVDYRGNEQWRRTYGGSEEDGANTLVETGDGGYLLGGWTYSYGSGGSDGWLVKVDSSGRQEWERPYGRAGGENGYSAIAPVEGGYLLAGVTNSGGSQDAWLVGVDEGGTEQWQGSYGGSADAGLFSVLQPTGGSYLFSGWTTDTQSGERDAWLVKLSATESTTTTYTPTPTPTTSTPTTSAPSTSTQPTDSPADTTTTSPTPTTTSTTTAGGPTGEESGDGGGSLLLPVIGGGGLLLAVGGAIAWRVLSGGDDDPAPSTGAGDGTPPPGDGSASPGDGSTQPGDAGSGGSVAAGSGTSGSTGVAGSPPPSGGGGERLGRARRTIDDAAAARAAGREGDAVTAVLAAVASYGDAVEAGEGTDDDREAVETAVYEFVEASPDPGRSVVPELVSALGGRDPATSGPTEVLLLRALGRVDPSHLARDESTAPAVAGYVAGPPSVADPASAVLAAVVAADPETRRAEGVTPAIEAGLTHDDDEVREHCVTAAAAVVEDAPADGRPFLEGLASNLGESGPVGATAASALARVLEEYPVYGAEFLPEMADGLRNSTPVSEGYAGATTGNGTVAEVTAAAVADVTDHDVTGGASLVAPLVALARDGEESSRAAAFRALSNLSAEYPDEAVDAVGVARLALDEGSVRVRRNAARLLANVAATHAEAVEPAVPDLVVTVDDDDDLRTRTAALDALGAVGASIPGAVESDVRLVVGRLDDDSTIVREHAAEVIVALAEADPGVVEPSAETADRLRRLQRDPAVDVDGALLEAAAVAIRTGEPMSDALEDAGTGDDGRPSTAAELDEGDRSGKTRVFNPTSGETDEGFSDAICPECGVDLSDESDPANCPNCGADLA